MTLAELYEIQKSGAFKVDIENSDDHNGIIGGVKLNAKQCALVAERLGWISYVIKPYEAIAWTDRFIRGIRSKITDVNVLNNTIVTFENSRLTDTVKYYYRVKLICPGYFDLTVLQGMPGVGGKFGIFSAKNMFRQPVESCMSLKNVGEYIGTLSCTNIA